MSWLTSWFTDLIATLKLIVWLLFAGAALGAACAFIGRLTRSLTGIAIAAAAGAVIVFGLHWSGAIDRLVDAKAKAEIATLQTQKAKLEQDLALANAVLALEREADVIEGQVAADNAATLAKLKDVIAAHEGDPECGAFADELQIIGEMK